MMRRALKLGVLSGFLISLAGLYPLITLVAPVIIPAFRAMRNELAHTLILMVSTAVATPALFGTGLLVARNARGWLEGAKAGVLAGFIAGMICYFTIILPLNALLAYSRVTRFLIGNTEVMQLPLQVLENYVNVFEQGGWLVELTLGGLALLWGIQGAVAGWRRRHLAEPERPSLFGLIHSGQHPRHWFDGDETAVKVGMKVGLVIGTLIVLLTFGWFSFVAEPQDWLQMIENGPNSAANAMNNPMAQLSTFLSPVVVLSFIGLGAVVVFLMKNPPDPFWSRLKATVLASVLVVGFSVAVLLRFIYFVIGLLPFIYYAHQGQIDPTAIPDIDPQSAAEFGEFLTTLPQLLASTDFADLLFSVTLILPWLCLLFVLAGGVSLGLAHGVIYGSLVPLLHKRAVDEAAGLQRRIERTPQETLPLVYGLFKDQDCAYDVLAHLSVRSFKKNPALSRLTAAMHTLGSGPHAEHDPAMETMRVVLAAETDWRWAADISSVYGTLHDVHIARSLEQILKVKPPPPQRTSSLPPVLVKGVQKIGRITKELHKVHKVEDLPTKLIFLENSLDAIHGVEKFVQAELENPTYSAAPLPEQVVLADILGHWQEIVLGSVKHLKGRADVVCTLQTTQTSYVSHLPLVIEVANRGLNVAQQVQLKLLPGEHYHLNEQKDGWIEILSPGESKQVDLTVLPVPEARRMRVAWEVTYDDAVDEHRRLEFGDMVEFIVPDKPFERIFPIPYVTGTPLKTDDVFVGREDVFAFIKENLLGAHQNNVIILHGQRRTGKTSVLYRLKQVMTDTHYAVLIDMQGKPARGEVDFLFSIADDIAFALEDHDIEIDLPEREDFEREGPEFYFRSRFLRGLRQHLGDKHLLLLFDEFEELQRRVEDGRLQPEIFQFLRNLMQHDRNVDFVFSGTHKLEELGAEYWSVLFNIAAYKPITFLSANEMRRLILEPVAQYPIEYDPLAIDRIINVTAGHPYFAQLVLHEMIVYHNETQRGYLTVSDVNRVLERIVERGEAHFKYIWSESSEEERLVLQAMTELLVGKETADVNDMVAFLDKRGYESADSWQTALKSVTGRDILMTPSAKSPFYRFKVDLIRHWIDQTRPAL